MEKSEVNLIRFSGKKTIIPLGLSSFNNILKEKKCEGTFLDQIQNQKMMRRAKWNTKDAKIKTWILGSVEPHFILNLKLHKTAQGMWRYLTKNKKNC